MGLEKFEELKESAIALGEDAKQKIIMLNDFIKRANLKEEAINLKIKELKALKEEVEGKERDLKYARLRILKIVNDKKLDEELKNELRAELNV